MSAHSLLTELDLLRIECRVCGHNIQELGPFKVDFGFNYIVLGQNVHATGETLEEAYRKFLA